MKQINFSPPPGTSFRVILTAGERREEFDFPLALTYAPLVRNMADTYRLEGSPKQVERQEALLGLWEAVRDFPGEEVRSPAGYFKTLVARHMGQAFDAASTEGKVVEQMRAHDRGWWDEEAATAMGAPPRAAPRRALKERVDSAGGSLDASPSVDAKEEAPPLGEAIEAPLSSDEAAIKQEALLQQVLDAIPDHVGREIVRMSALEKPQKEIAKALGITQPAVSQHLARLRRNPKIRNLLER